MTFDPKKHMLNMKGKDYLEVKWRLVWFKDDHPQGGVKTEVLYLEPLIVIKATILTADGVALATGHGTAQAKQGAVWAGREIEKAETAAIGRALAHAGYGTQFTDEDEGTHLADSPVERKQQRPASGNAAPNAPASTPVTSAVASTDVSGIVPSGAVVTEVKRAPSKFPQVGAVNMAGLWRRTSIESRPHFDSLIRQLLEQQRINDQSSEQDVLNAIDEHYAEKAVKS